MDKKVYLVDGSGYIFRAFYAVQSLKTKEGFPTNALYGFTRMLLRLLSEADSQHVVMVFDSGRETFRNELYTEYKANRKECPEDLVQQMPYFREISKALGLQILEEKGFEADDIIGTLAKHLKRHKIECVIVSGDKDLMQLVEDGISIWDTMKDRRYGRDDVQSKMGVYPEKIVDLLGIMGDSSDNIPGLKGAGPKTAVQLIEKYGDIETIIKSAQAIGEDKDIRNRKKISEQIELDAEVLRLSRKLAQVECAVPLKFKRIGNSPEIIESEEMEIENFKADEFFSVLGRRSPDQKALSDLVTKLEFTSLLKDIKLDIPKPEEKIEVTWNYQTVWAEDFKTFLAKISQQKEFALDLETTSLDVLAAEIVGASFCWSKDEAFYIPLLHKNSNKGQVSLADFKQALAPILNDKKVKKIGQNLKYDTGVLSQQGIELEGIYFDTMIAAYLLNPDRRSYNLTALSQDYLGRGVTEYDEIVAEGQDFRDVEVDVATRYACQDAHLAWVLRDELAKRIEAQELGEVLDKIEIPLIPVLSRMERAGIKLDRAKLEILSKQFAEELEKLKAELYSMAGGEFNINSPKQLAEVLFVKLGLSEKGLKRTKTGTSTDSSVLEKLASQHPLPELILRYRTLHKLKSTYVDTLPEQISNISGRLHTKFNQTVAATGRLSSSDPNLQNIPIQTSEGRKIREAFIAEDDKVLLSADYSQIELRILAHISGDENLISAFNNNIDIHSKTAREILKLDPNSEVSIEHRRMGKTINFGVIYGMSGFRLGRELGIPVSVANQYIQGYFDGYPKVAKLFSALELEAQTQGYVKTLSGRRRVISDLDTSERDKGFALRAAINAPMQGTAADLIKLAMVQLDEKIRSEKIPMRMLLQIHDELIFECASSFVESAKKIVVEIMEGVMQLKVPLKVDCGFGKNWQEAHS